jgi:hypothetical protein
MPRDGSQRGSRASPLRAAAPARGARAASPWLGAAVVFAAALALRILFWLATPGLDWPHSIFFKGDAVVWLEHALSLERGGRSSWACRCARRARPTWSRCSGTGGARASTRCASPGSCRARWCRR